MSSLQERVEEAAREVQEDQKILVWKTYRQYEPADLEALIRYAKSGVETASKAVERALKEDDSEAAVEAGRALGQHQIRLTVAKRQLHWRAHLLEEPPEWGSAPAIPPLVGQELTTTQKETVQERLIIKAAFEELTQNGHSKSEAYDKISERRPKSRSQIKKIVTQERS